MKGFAICCPDCGCRIPVNVKSTHCGLCYSDIRAAVQRQAHNLDAKALHIAQERARRNAIPVLDDTRREGR